MSNEQGWAGTTEDRYDLHRFGTDRSARCNPNIRTYSRTTSQDATREPYATLRTRAEIIATGFPAYKFCTACDTRKR
jgi:hypothetical protein